MSHYAYSVGHTIMCVAKLVYVELIHYKNKRYNERKEGRRRKKISIMTKKKWHPCTKKTVAGFFLIFFS